MRTNFNKISSSFIIFLAFLTANQNVLCNLVPPVSAKIVGGIPAKPGEFKSNISVRTSNGGVHLCGGTLIDASHVVTSADCLTDDQGRVVNANDIHAMGDDLNVGSIDYSAYRQLRRGHLIFVHVAFNANTLVNNIAVIRVADPFVFTDTFSATTIRTTTPPNNRVCQLAGWGEINDNGVMSDELMRIDVGIIAMNVCNRENAYNGSVVPGTLCAGSMFGGRGACPGDYGGGLMCDEILSGVVSYGLGCGRPNYPNVFTDVSVYRTFIEEAVKWIETGQEPPVPPTVAPPGDAASSMALSAIVLAVAVCVNIYI